MVDPVTKVADMIESEHILIHTLVVKKAQMETYVHSLSILSRSIFPVQ